MTYIILFLIYKNYIHRHLNACHMRKLVLSLLVLGFATQLYAQDIKTEQIKEIVISAVNYKYLNAVDNSNVAIPVQRLQNAVAMFDLKNSDFYEDEYDLYRVRFYIPEGQILAAYNSEGRLLRTVERFKDIALPNEVASAVFDRFPGWEITNDVYLVRFTEDEAKRVYKLTLKNGNKTMRVKIDPYGKFL